MKKIAVMQPYFLPYIGYWQLIKAVDTFVILDNVNFIKKGYINRNYLLHNGQKHLFTLPVEKLSQNILICDTRLAFSEKEKTKLLTTIKYSYKQAPFFRIVFPMLEKIITYEESRITEYICHSIQNITNYLDIKTQFCLASKLEIPKTKGQEYIIDICKYFNARTYINPINGKSIYSKETFHANRLELFFLRANNIDYSQYQHAFVPFLSILDILMFNAPEKIHGFLLEFQLEEN